ncbi:hypothetical protein J6590_064243 [Homalodisca vitripennis]|nr:hypothetical protein J6590_064243 [Homalodisca vitripennis]
MPGCRARHPLPPPTIPSPSFWLGRHSIHTTCRIDADTLYRAFPSGSMPTRYTVPFLPVNLHILIHAWLPCSSPPLPLLPSPHHHSGSVGTQYTQLAGSMPTRYTVPFLPVNLHILIHAWLPCSSPPPSPPTIPSPSFWLGRHSIHTTCRIDADTLYHAFPSG